MKSILKADLKKFLKSKIPLVLIIVAVALPLFNSLVTSLIFKLTSNETGVDMSDFVNNPFTYASSFSPINNVGILLLIFVVIVGAGDFTQSTIRNKIIAGHTKNNIYLSSLILNLTIMLVTMFVYSTLSYLFNGIFLGFKAGELEIILKFAVIGFSGLIVLYAILTLFLYLFKNIAGSLLLTLGVLIGLIAINGLLTMIPASIIDFSFFQHVVPLIRINVFLTIDVSLWWLALIVNIAYLGLFVFLGLLVSNKTDYK